MTENNRTTPPVDPSTLPDPEDITEADVGQAPPARRQKKRRFGGTHRQIRSAQSLYKFTAWLTGIFLLLLVFQMIVKYGFGRELFAGGTTEDGTEFVLGLYHEQAVVEGVNISLLILIVHGWLYVLYLLGCFRLWSMMRWGGVRLLYGRRRRGPVPIVFRRKTGQPQRRRRTGRTPRRCVAILACRTRLRTPWIQ